MEAKELIGRTLVLLKPDVPKRQIIGEILTRFERKGFKIVAMKMVHADEKLAGEHYTSDKKYLKEVGGITIKMAKSRGETPWSNDPLEIGKAVRKKNIDYLVSGPLIAMVIEGSHVIELVRKMIGSGNPLFADVGTIRADYTPDSYRFADLQGRTARNMIHASDSDENAEREIKLWFSDSELLEYETAIEKVLFGEL